VIPSRTILALLAALLLGGCGGRDGTRDARPPEDGGGSGGGAGGATRGRVIVVGIDGADWRVIEPLAARGRLPSFRRLVEHGASGVLMSMHPSASPSLWTTVATGVGPDRHGIHGFVEETGGPRVRPVTSTMRRAPAFWNILPAYDRKVGVVGWLVTWPAEPTDGYIVSSYLPYLYNWSTGRPLKGTLVEGIPHQTFPAGLIDELQPLRVKPADLPAEAVRRFYDPERVARLSRDDRECVRGFLWSLACDQTFGSIGLRLFERYPVDLFAVYFGGIDVASHRFWKFAYPEALRYQVTPEEVAVLGRVIEEYYVAMDGRVGEYLERLRPADTLVVLSDHGFQPVLEVGHPTTSGHHRDQGILAVYGAAARRGHRIATAGLLDVLPTLLAILDVPIAMDLEGRVLEEALDPAFLKAHPPRFVERYDAPGGPALPDRSDLDANVLERLRSLGYID
jgi:predicted AlkP superfamily phosphohydrolase/phosphomutase